jgi:hypothetical protein
MHTRLWAEKVVAIIKRSFLYDKRAGQFGAGRQTDGQNTTVVIPAYLPLGVRDILRPIDIDFSFYFVFFCLE